MPPVACLVAVIGKVPYLKAFFSEVGEDVFIEVVGVTGHYEPRDTRAPGKFAATAFTRSAADASAILHGFVDAFYAWDLEDGFAAYFDFYHGGRCSSMDLVRALGFVRLIRSTTGDWNFGDKVKPKLPRDMLCRMKLASAHTTMNFMPF